MTTPNFSQMNLGQCKYWIFDMDGTLTLAVHDFDEIRETLGINQGKPILEAIDEMPEATAAAMMEQLFDIEMQIAKEANEQPGARALLEHLTSQGCSLGILTRNGCEIAIETLRAAGLLEFFKPQTVLGRESCTPKPDPAGVNQHLAAWQADPKATVMVGDYKFDLEAGYRAGVSTVHLDVDQGERWPEITTVKVSSLDELMQKLKC